MGELLILLSWRKVSFKARLRGKKQGQFLFFINPLARLQVKVSVGTIIILLIFILIKLFLNNFVLFFSLGQFIRGTREAVMCC